MDFGDILVLLIILYGIFGGRKKKQRDVKPTEVDEPRFEIPTIKGNPNAEKVKKLEVSIEEPMIKTEEAIANTVSNRYREYLLAKTKSIEAKQVSIETPTSDKVVRKTADIHSDVLLNAVAYSQILQPPKAYQYMATKSCRGEWQNNK